MTARRLRRPDPHRRQPLIRHHDARDHISVAALATVANLTVGFDCSACLERPLERLDLKRTDTPVSKSKTSVDLPMEVEHNVSGMAARSVLNTLGARWGVELTIHKAVLPGSGIGLREPASAAGWPPRRRRLPT